MNIEIEGLKILIEDDDELDKAVRYLRSIIDVFKPDALKFLCCLSEARGSEIRGRDMRRLYESKFYPEMTFEEVRKRARDAITRISLVNEACGGEPFSEEQVDKEVEELMTHCFESSEGVILFK